MTGTIRVGLVGDYNPDVKAHRAIPLALQMAAQANGVHVESHWLPTETLETTHETTLARYDAIWCVPASPYKSMRGALLAIRFARERQVPFLGTCGGFQHALIEIARDVHHIQDASHAETDPNASVLLVSPLTCALRDVEGSISLREGSRIRRIYGTGQIREEFNCGFGLNPAYKDRLKGAGLAITGTDEVGDARVIELAGHPFFIATLYQPERSALKGHTHPLISAYVTAALEQHRQAQTPVEVQA